MPDNVGYTPGSGATVAADDVGGVLYQRVKLAFGADGSASDVSQTNGIPIEIISDGELAEQLDSIRYNLNIIANIYNNLFVDQTGKQRVSIEVPAGVVLATSVSDITSVSGLGAYGDLFIQMRMENQSLRRNLSLT